MSVDVTVPADVEMETRPIQEVNAEQTVFTADEIHQMYVFGMAPQLQRTYPMRCISCRNFTPAKLGVHGTCSAIGAKATNDAISVTGSVTTHATAFGCLLWAELDEDALHDRTEIAIRRNLMDDMPEDFDPGEPLKARMRERKQAVDGVAVAVAKHP